MIKKIFSILILFGCFSSVFAVDAVMDIVKKVGSETRITVLVDKDSSVGDTLGSKVLEMLLNDLRVTERFKLIESKNFAYDAKIDGLAAIKDSEIVLKYKLSMNGQALYADVKILDGASLGERFNKRYFISTFDKYPFLSHKITEDLNSFIKAPPIDWMGRFVVFSRNLKPKSNEIVLSDYTLTYQKPIVSGGFNIFPKWADVDQKAIYYTSYDNGHPTLYKQIIESGKREKVVSSDGMLVCSDVSRDGKKLLLTMAPASQPDIFLYEMQTGAKQNLTNYAGIDVKGNFVENDKKIVFISDRLGKPTIFAKTIDKEGVEQLLFEGKGSSSLSAKNNLIVYVTRESDYAHAGNGFNLYLMGSAGGEKRKLTSSGENGFPRFSATGDAILFIKTEGGKNYLGIVRVDSSSTFLFPLKAGKIDSLDW